jgi:DNA invertase Pin-like site-specific DNA recombinase
MCFQRKWQLVLERFDGHIGHRLIFRHREPVLMGLDRARRQGKKLGRPRTLVDREKVASLRAKGLSLRQIATELKVSKDKVARVQM